MKPLFLNSDRIPGLSSQYFYLIMAFYFAPLEFAVTSPKMRLTMFSFSSQGHLLRAHVAQTYTVKLTPLGQEEDRVWPARHQKSCVLPV